MISDNTIVIGLVGGPCCGKSVTASALFAELKKTNIEVELITEPIKAHIYHDHRNILTHQISLFAERLYALDCLKGKVDVIIQDGSLLLDTVYDQSNNLLFKSLVIQEYHRFKNLDFFLKRGDMPFQEYGRIHNYEQAIELDERIRQAYVFANASYIEINSQTAVQDILNTVSNFS